MSTHESRFGFHPCDYQTFKDLKLLHKLYWQAVHDFHKWQRWNRKLPKNRVVRKWLKDSEGRKYGFEVVGPAPEPVYNAFFVEKNRWGQLALTDKGIIEAYQNARTPHVVSQVKPLNLSLATIAAFLERNNEFKKAS